MNSLEDFKWGWPDLGKIIPDAVRKTDSRKRSKREARRPVRRDDKGLTQGGGSREGAKWKASGYA